MIKFINALGLARTKFQNRKLRHFFSGFAVSLGIMIILTLLFATTGILKTGKHIFIDRNAGRFFVAEGIARDNIGAFDKSKYKNDQHNFEITNVFTQRVITKSTFGLENLVNQDELSQLEIRSLDPVFVKDFLGDGYSFEDEYDGKIPVIVPKSLILKKEYANYDELSQKEKYTVAQKTLGTYLGKEVNLLTFEQAVEQKEKTPDTQPAQGKDTGIKLMIVGFSSTSILSTQDIFLISESLLLPEWAFEARDDVKKLLADSYSLSAISEFKTKAERDEFLRERNKDFNAFSADNLSSESLENGPLIPLDGRYEIFSAIIKSVKNAGLGVGGFFLAVSGLFVLTTVGKIVGDSKKEIGLFRAVGATKFDIYKIVISYSLLIVNIGFFIGLLLALVVTYLASQQWGSELFYLLLNFSTASQVELPNHLFLEVPVLPTLAAYVVAMLIGCVACLLPARKAAKIDPAKVLKEE